MAITPIGFDGSVDEASWAKLMSLAGSQYTVATPADYATTPVAGARAVTTAPGSAFGSGVLAINPTAVQTNLKTPAAGQFFLIALHRDWAANTCAIIAIDGPTTSTATPAAPPAVLPAAIDSTPGVKDDQPLYWAWVNNSSTTVTLWDLRKPPTDARLTALELSPIRKGTAAARDAFWGLPATQADRLALQALSPRWFNTTTLCEETYFADFDVAKNPAGTVSAGWFPVDGLLPALVMQATATQAIAGGSWNFLNGAWGTPNTPTIARQFSAAAGVVTCQQDGLYDIDLDVGYASFAGFTRAGVQITLNNGNADLGVVAKAMYTTQNSVNCRSVVRLAKGDRLFTWTTWTGSGSASTDTGTMPPRLQINYLSPA